MYNYGKVARAKAIRSSQNDATSFDLITHDVHQNHVSRNAGGSCFAVKYQ